MAWKVTAAAFVIIFFCFGIGVYGPSIFLHHLHERHGWSIAIISAAISGNLLCSAAIVAWLPELHRYFGIVLATRLGAVALIVGLMGWGFAQTPWQLLEVAPVFGAGLALTGSAAVIAMVSPWFPQRRSSALAYALSGTNVGGLVMSPVWATLVDAYGFSIAALLVAGVGLAVIWCLAGRYLRDGPEVPRNDKDRSASVSFAPPTPMRMLFKNRRFLTLSIAFALAMFGQIGFMVNLVARLAPVLGETAAAASLGLVALCSIAGRIGLGILIGHTNRRIVAASGFAISAVGLGLIAFGATPGPLLAGCVLVGLAASNLFLLPPLIAQAEFQSTDVARVVALVTSLNQITLAFAPAVSGLAHDLSGNYVMPFLILTFAQVIAGAAILLGGRSR